MDIHALLQTIAKVINDIKNNFTNYYTTNSLTDAAKLTRVEPLTIISKDCINLEYMPDVMNSILSIFSGYYLQAVSMLTKVNDVEVVRILDKLNPDRDESGFLLSEQVSHESLHQCALESYAHSLPVNKTQMWFDPKDGKNKEVLDKDGYPVTSRNDEMSSVIKDENSKDNVTSINELSNLSVGKLLNVQIVYNKTDRKTGHKSEETSVVTMPVSVRLMASVLPNSTIMKLLALKTDDEGLVERFHKWRSGRIGFIKDLVFCQDLIDEHKRAMVGDETDTMIEIMRRVNNAKKYGLITKNPSLVSASNIFVMSEEVARDVESKMGGKLSNSRIRQRVFENTYAMLLVVVDREWERVSIYSRGISGATDLSIKELKNASKNKGPDVTEILKSLQIGAAPVF